MCQFFGYLSVNKELQRIPKSIFQNNMELDDDHNGQYTRRAITLSQPDGPPLVESSRWTRQKIA